MDKNLLGNTVERYGAEAEFRRSGSLLISKPDQLLVHRSSRGAYDPDGSLIESTVNLWHPGADLPDSVPAELTDRHVVRVCDDEVVWAGGVVHAYGHFLIESVSRLWPLLPDGELEDQPIVWTTPRELPYIQEWCEAFGLRCVDLPREGAVHFTRVSVPEPAWSLNAWIAPEIRDIHLHARATLPTRQFPKVDVLWLSRSGLVRSRAAYDEVLLEWLLRKHVMLVSPELMSVSQQIGAIESCKAAAGIVGSAFHTMLMAKRIPECFLISGGLVRGAYVDQDLLLGEHTKFVYGLAAVEAAYSGRLQFPQKLPFGYRVLIPEVLRALAQSVLPDLLDDPDLYVLAEPERPLPAVGSASNELVTAIARVLLDPMWMNARMRLGQICEGCGLHNLALEQYTMVAELSDTYAARASHYAARNLVQLGRLGEATAMAERALAIDPQEVAAAAYVNATRTDD